MARVRPDEVYMELEMADAIVYYVIWSKLGGDLEDALSREVCSLDEEDCSGESFFPDVPPKR